MRKYYLCRVCGYLVDETYQGGDCPHCEEKNSLASEEEYFGEVEEDDHQE